MDEKTIVAMSGGVDSAVAACLLHQQSHELMGITLKLYDNEDAGISKGHTCCSLDDIEDARRVSNGLGIPYYVLNFKDGFREKVMNKFVEMYRCGATPNPCIDCNRYIKFDFLLNRADMLGFDNIATGHYARRSYDSISGRWLMHTGIDNHKDQTYMLYVLSQPQLARTLFPVGELTKEQVRKIAEDNNLINAHKHDSQDICFVPDGDYVSFIERYSGSHFSDGDFVDTSGNILGRHKGIIGYTIGQRRGLGLALPQPLYVCEKDTANNRVVLGTDDMLYSNQLTANELNFIAVDKLTTPMRVKAKVRYSQNAQWCKVEQTGEDTVHVCFESAQRAITPGQAVVFYDGDIVVGGGTITK